MQCTSPRRVYWKRDGSGITLSPKNSNSELAAFQIPCRKCISCRLMRGREVAVRAYHEGQMHSENCFITLTYRDECLSSDRLVLRDWQLFLKDLRYRLPDRCIKVLRTGEYGGDNKRPHWHAILFGWRPSDLVKGRVNKHGDQTYKSQFLDELWGKNDPKNCPTVVGDLTLRSAGYVARYALKKLEHGKDEEHDYDPKSHFSGIGKSWIEKFWPDVFNYGEVIGPDGESLPIPRYYEKWLKKYKAQEWIRYVTEVKPLKEAFASYAEAKESQRWWQMLEERRSRGSHIDPITKLQTQKKLIDHKHRAIQLERSEKC